MIEKSFNWFIDTEPVIFVTVVGIVVVIVIYLIGDTLRRKSR